MRFPSLHKLHAQKYKTSLPHRFRQCNGKPGRWVIFHIPFFAVSARGATCGRQPAPGFPKFQFTPLREGRPGVLVEVVNVYTISIHAPARGATLRAQLEGASPLFQFTPLREGRLVQQLRLAIGPLFQFTPLREGRRGWYILVLLLYVNFNSRPCERGDKGLTFAVQLIIDFNSRPCERGDPGRPGCAVRP